MTRGPLGRSWTAIPTRARNRPPWRCGHYSPRTAPIAAFPTHRRSRTAAAIGSPRDQRADVLGQPLRDSAAHPPGRRPVRHRTVTRHHAPRRDRRELVEDREPALQAAVEHRHVPQKHEVAGEQRAGGLVQHRQVGVGVRGAPGLQPQHAPAEVEAASRRRPSASARRSSTSSISRAQAAAKRVEIELAARRQRLRQIGVADERRARLRERRIAEEVIGMHMRVDHVADRLGGQRCGSRRATGAPSRTLPPLSITATASLPTTKPILAMRPRSRRHQRGLARSARRRRARLRCSGKRVSACAVRVPKVSCPDPSQVIAKPEQDRKRTCTKARSVAE